MTAQTAPVHTHTFATTVTIKQEKSRGRVRLKPLRRCKQQAAIRPGQSSWNNEWRDRRKFQSAVHTDPRLRQELGEDDGLRKTLVFSTAFTRDNLWVGARRHLPPRGLAFFNTQSCPAGWSLASDASGHALNGFFLVPFTPPITAGLLGTTVGNPMGNGEIRTHSHTFTSSITVSGMTWAGKAGCQRWLDLCDKDTAADGAMTFSGTTGASDSGVPYIQLLLCSKTDFNRNQNPPVGIPPIRRDVFHRHDLPDRLETNTHHGAGASSPLYRRTAALKWPSAVLCSAREKIAPTRIISPDRSLSAAQASSWFPAASNMASVRPEPTSSPERPPPHQAGSHTPS